MTRRPSARRPVSVALSAALLLSSWGPVVSSAAAQQIAGRASSVSVVPQLSVVPSGIAAPMMGSPAFSPSLLLPALTSSLPASAIIHGAVAAAIPVVAIAASAIDAVKPAATGEAYGRAAAEDFARRVTGEELSTERYRQGSVTEPYGTVISQAPVAPSSRAGWSALWRPTVGAGSLSRPLPTRPNAARPTKPEGEKRWAFFPLWLAALSGAIWGAVELSRWGSSALSAQSAQPAAGTTVLAVAAAAAMVLTGAFVLNTVVDAAVFVAAMRRGRKVSDAQLSALLRAEVLEGRLDGNAAALVKPYRPDNRYKDFTFAFASRGLIWVRPELAATPWLLRQVLLHELHHMTVGAPRGPPRGTARGLLAALLSEARARAAEFKGPGALKQIQVPALQRALTQTQTSLRLPRPYEILVLNPDTVEFEDPKLYDGLSDGAARVTVLKNSAPAPALAERRRRYRAIVLGRAARALPEPKTKEALRLEIVFKQLDSLSLLATRLVVRGGAFDSTPESRAWTDLVDRASRLRESGSRWAQRAFAGEVRKLWRQIASQRLKGVGVSELLDGLYGGLLDGGFAFLSFGPDDRGVVSWEKLLRYWEAEDGGQFRVTRVDLEDGGHLLILRKVEARVGLWLRPTSGGHIKTSVANASFTEEGRATARKSLQDAGLGSQLELFDKMEVIVRHVFGADVGRQEIYVTVPRRNASAIRKYVSASAEIADPEYFQVHLMDTAGLQGVKPVWRAGITGAAGSIFWIDTGGDISHEDFGGRLDVIDMVAEGSEDWVGHGTHIAGISISGNAGFLGMAKAAKGTMAKVFSRDQPGASDGEIMAAAVVAQKKSADVISLSLGLRGSSADNLAEFFSQLTHQKNAAGEYPIVTASAGNAGPFDRTLSQPGAGVDVIAVGSLTKSLDDGMPEHSFFSSSGFDIDRRSAVKRYRFKPDLVAIGGDVVTVLLSAIIYLFGIFSSRSKDALRAASDLEDGKHTGMSGTSQSNALVAGIALLVKLALRAVGALTPAKAGEPASFLSENLPFAVKAILMRTATDVMIPVTFQGAGLVNAWAAVSLVSESAGRAFAFGVKRLWHRLTSDAPATAPEGWSWLERLKAVQDAEDRVFREAELAKSEARARLGEDAPDESSEEPRDRSASGSAAAAEVQRRFNAARDVEVPRLLEALKDPVWLVRFKAAFALMNLRAPATAAALAEAGLHDADGRVRQMAFLALAEIPTRSTLALLQKAAGAQSWDVGVYAAYALLRRGDGAQVARVLKELSNADKRARFTSAWLLGQIGGHAAEAEGLSARVRDRAERGNIRHLSAAALSNLADAVPEALSDRVVTDLLDAAGPENLALTSTIAKVFPVAVRSKAFVARLRAEPLKSVVTDFVVKNRDAISRPGALSALVSLLARAAAIPLDAPTAPMDSSGLGVSGVDSAMGPVDLFAVPPPYGGGIPKIDAAMLMRFETTARAVLPLSRALWLSVPEHKLYALTIALEHTGWSVRRSLPYYPLSRAPAEGGGLILDLGDGETPPEIPAGADLSLVRVRAAGGVSEVRVMAALERVAEAAKGGPALVALTLAAPTTRRAPLSLLIDRLVAADIGVVVGAGNAGPKLDTVAAPGDSGLAVVVAAASRAGRVLTSSGGGTSSPYGSVGLQFYSARGTPETPRVTWTDLVDDLQPGEILAAAAAGIFGTGAAAERTAAKLAELARVLFAGFAAKGRALPDGWFPYLVGLVKSSLTLMPAYGAHEVGAGLFDAPERTLDLLRARLFDIDALEREAKALADEARLRSAPPAPSPVPR